MDEGEIQSHRLSQCLVFLRTRPLRYRVLVVVYTGLKDRLDLLKIMSLDFECGEMFQNCKIGITTFLTPLQATLFRHIPGHSLTNSVKAFLKKRQGETKQLDPERLSDHIELSMLNCYSSTSYITVA